MATIDRLLCWMGLDFDVDLREQLFHRTAPRVFLGSRPTPGDVEALAHAGITDVVSCLAPSEQPAMGFLEDFRTQFLPLHDGIHDDIAATFPRFFEFLSGAGPDSRVLVHCQAGVSRSATLVTAHRMVSSGSRFFEAFSEVRAARPQVLPNIGFASQLQHLEDSRHPPRPSGELASLTRYLHRLCKVPAEVDTLQMALEDHGFDAVQAIRSIFGGDIPRVVQGVRTR